MLIQSKRSSRYFSRIDIAQGCSRGFNNVLLETLHECNDVTLLNSGHLELGQGCRRVAEKYGPIAFAYPHSAVCEHHIAPPVI